MFRATLPPVIAFGLIAGMTAQPAHAADYLRGAYAGETRPAALAGPDWGGYYAGAHGGASSATVDASRLSKPLADAALPNATSHNPLLQSSINFTPKNKSGASYGGFVGFNVLWDDVVLGVEADYSHSNIRANSAYGPYGLYTDTGTVRNGVNNVVSEARGQVSDWATLRGRAGYAMGMFMPYLTAGIAVGNVDARASTSGNYYTQSLNTPPSFPTATGSFAASVGRRGVVYGGAFGGGVDMQLLPGTFLRAEYQSIQFASGGKRPDIAINTARVGGGVKF